jgi:hypothetical protein
MSRSHRSTNRRNLGAQHNTPGCLRKSTRITHHLHLLNAFSVPCGQYDPAAHCSIDVPLAHSTAHLRRGRLRKVAPTMYHMRMARTKARKTLRLKRVSWWWNGVVSARIVPLVRGVQNFDSYCARDALVVRRTKIANLRKTGKMCVQRPRTATSAIQLQSMSGTRQGL